MPVWIESLAAAAAGALLGWAYRTGPSGIAAWLALAPLFWLVARARPRRALGLGTLYGLCVYWVGYPVGIAFLSRFLGVGAAAAAGAFLVLCAAEGFLRWGAWSWACSLAPARWRPAALVAAVVLADRFSPALMPAPLALTQLFHLPTVQSVALLGDAWIAALLAVFNAALWLVLARRDRASVLALAAAGALALANDALGRRQLRGEPAASKRALNVALIQGGAAPDWEATADVVSPRTPPYARLTAQAARAGALDLAVWPESTFQPRVEGLSSGRELRVPLAGCPAGVPLLLNGRGGGGRLSNVSILVDGSHRVEGISVKRMLIPFGEYIPYERVLPVLRRLLPRAGHLAAGRDYEPLVLGRARIGVLICFENMFPGPAAELTARGARLLIVQANDSFCDRPWGPELHLGFSRLRAIENGLPVLHATTSGVSAVISPTGGVVARLDGGEKGFLRERVELAGNQDLP